MIVGADVVAVTGLIPGAGPRPVVSLQDRDSGRDPASAGSVPQVVVQVTLTGTLVGLGRQQHA
jgi:hypothetical protein